MQDLLKDANWKAIKSPNEILDMARAKDQSYNINQLKALRDEAGNTAMHRAAQAGNLDLVKALSEMDYSGDIANLGLENYGKSWLRTPNNKWQTPIFFAASEGHNDIVKLLIEGGASVYQKDSYRDTPLDVAEREPKKQEIINAIMQKINEDDENFLALIKNMDDVNDKKNWQKFTNKLGFESTVSPLIYAILHGWHKSVEKLLEKGADVNEKIGGKGKEGHTPLHLAVLVGDLTNIKQLIAKGADVSSKTDLARWFFGVSPTDRYGSAIDICNNMLQKARLSDQARNRYRQILVVFSPQPSELEQKLADLKTQLENLKDNLSALAIQLNNLKTSLQ